MTSSSPAFHLRYTLSPNTSFTEREQQSTSSRGETSSAPRHGPTETTMLLGSTITTGSTIGLPSKYPGSAAHNRINSLESSVLLEELQDFDDIFGQVQPSFSNNSLNHNNDKDENDNARESLISRSQSDYNDDDDDDLKFLTQSLPSRLNLHHRRNVSELSTSSHSNIPVSLFTPPVGVVTEKSRVSVSAGSICSSSSNTRSISSAMSHRRSRNRAMSSTDFQSAVLDEL